MDPGRIFSVNLNLIVCVESDLETESEPKKSLSYNQKHKILTEGFWTGSESERIEKKHNRSTGYGYRCLVKLEKLIEILGSFTALT